ncbi:MAG: PsiF family protein [Burkholderiaceae bacterium]|nr:PsiF family protein [Burkholderiaceae bacterium]
MLKHLLLAASLALPLAAATAEEKKLTPQQERMAVCNKQASDKKLAGDDRKKFMSDCLAGKVAAADDKKLTPQQEKMRVCNKQAGDKKLEGDARKKFMSECLKAA